MLQHSTPKAVSLAKKLRALADKRRSIFCAIPSEEKKTLLEAADELERVYQGWRDQIDSEVELKKNIHRIINGNSK